MYTRTYTSRHGTFPSREMLHLIYSKIYLDRSVRIQIERMIEPLNMHRSFLHRVFCTTSFYGTINFSLFYEQPRKKWIREREAVYKRGKHLPGDPRYIDARFENRWILLSLFLSFPLSPRPFFLATSPSSLYLFNSRYNWFHGCIDACWNSRAYLIAYFPFDVKCSFVARKFAFHHYVPRYTARI